MCAIKRIQEDPDVQKERQRRRGGIVKDDVAVAPAGASRGVEFELALEESATRFFRDCPPSPSKSLFGTSIVWPDNHALPPISSHTSHVPF